MIIKILLDECLPKKLRYRIEESDPEFFVKTVQDVGWASIVNGELLAKAEKEFDVFITSDRNLSFQQSISSSDICVFLLSAPTNVYEDLLPLVSKLATKIRTHEPGKFEEII
ncbi:MAG: hypothetical protein WD038_03905 [Balneolales bacterium]